MKWGLSFRPPWSAREANWALIVRHAVYTGKPRYWCMGGNLLWVHGQYVHITCLSYSADMVILTYMALKKRRKQHTKPVNITPSNSVRSDYTPEHFRWKFDHNIYYRPGKRWKCSGFGDRRQRGNQICDISCFIISRLERRIGWSTTVRLQLEIAWHCGISCR